MKKFIWDNIGTDSVTTGGSKARRDALYFLKEIGFKKIPYFNDHNILLKCIKLLFNFISFPFYQGVGNTLLIQYPLNIGQRYILVFFKKLLKIKCIFLVHDLESLRLGYSKQIEKRDFLLADSIIALNSRMSNYIRVELEYTRKISHLKLWDYAPPTIVEDKKIFNIPAFQDKINVFIVGNLDKKKAGYLTELHKLDDIHFYLVGKGLESTEILSPNVTYLGAFNNELQEISFIAKEEGKLFGLVWDGETIENCTSSYGEYLKMNTPHKTSFYLYHHLPIIVWNQSAIYKELSLYPNVALGVSSLYDIVETVSQFTLDENNIKMLSNYVRSGYFLKRALKELE